MKRALVIISAIFILTGCGGKKNNPAPAAPSAAVLSLPSQNEVCTTGTIISATASSITFTWNASANTDSYALTLKNLLTLATTTQNTSATKLTLTLLRNTPYSWSVTSLSSKTSTTAQSDVWKFYNAGPGVVTYAPFPAEIVSPTFGQLVTANAGTVNLKWTGSSVNPGTIVNYDVYFGTTAMPPVLKSAVTGSFINNVAVVSKTTYYWKIITRDIQGNTSDSGIFQFTVN
ncbi:hypothetical protein [Mucilaginibacter gotjawali]|uniref:Uncharacterized protein n=2 Tax=Mucilaginibacter gotjawali TaxID=1550579 RepID=A0A125T258_9SPHI|nr:hypothetical protein [Mucilaginibacter gotjawali]MBB3058580.1 hypothetical protein [Mucilaginibacter gotjawali]BAU52454.1 hypothetical protein MgSA37_00615 [Mucilaginibacter gotjawali]